MNTPDDRVALTVEERRALAALEDRTGRDDPKFNASLGSSRLFARLHSRRVRDVAAGLSFAAGVALMLTTFVRWPAIAVIGIGVQLISFRALLARWGPPIGASIQQRLRARRERIT
jgi:hypothetical protein